MAIRTFTVGRSGDESGISGTGIVAEGVVFSDSSCVVRWTAATSPSHSTGIFSSLSDFLMIHVASHPDNKTKCVFDDGTVYDHTTKIEPTVTKPKRERKKKAVAAT